MVPNAVAAPSGEISVSGLPDSQPEAPRQPDAHRDRVIALEIVQRAGDDMVADRLQRLADPPADAAHQAAASSRRDRR